MINSLNSIYFKLPRKQPHPHKNGAILTVQSDAIKAENQFNCQKDKINVTFSNILLFLQMYFF